MEIVRTIELRHPVTLTLRDGDGREREETVKVLEIRRPKVKHIKVVDRVDGDVEKAIELSAVLSGQPARVIEELDSEDFTEVMAVVERFFPKRPGTGRKS